ncbi:class I SAM-dependent methyltransferase [Macrococcus lamae]|uniref:SAM-dependent methyltransferase n=1 Tax=Macrococcus lamae TaxID=198484 RepID=A0A4R6BXN2_9STAP|nr:class I SAM-dependent methyltransferase [Macrococcus lamae]TDM13252.1 hypothetical protein ERX29_01230 [Macrococcus lamae]
MNIVSKVRITSPVKTDDVIFLMMKQAYSELQSLELDLSVEIIPRRKRTIKELFKNDSSPVIVISHHMPVLYFSAEEKVFYHENTMRFKLKRFNKYGDLPPLIEILPVASSDAVTIVDATMGMGNDLMLMAHILIAAEFHAFETHPLIYFVIKEGIVKYHAADITERITFHYGSAVRNSLVSTADIVYADPMFETTIGQNSGMQVINRQITTEHNEQLVSELVKSSQCIILKAHFRSQLFVQFGFDVIIRKSSKSHFGILKKQTRK